MPRGSNYLRMLSLREALTLEAIVAYKLRSTGAKMLINPNAEYSAPTTICLFVNRANF